MKHCLAACTSYVRHITLLWWFHSSESNWSRRWQCHKDQPVCQLPPQPASFQRSCGDGDGLKSHGPPFHGWRHLYCWVCGVWGQEGSGVARSRQKWRQTPRSSKSLAHNRWLWCLLFKYHRFVVVTRADSSLFWDRIVASYLYLNLKNTSCLLLDHLTLERNINHQLCLHGPILIKLIV